MKRVTILFWLSIAFGFAVSPVTAIGAETAKGTPLLTAVSQWIGHLFERGYNQFLLALIVAAPFIAVGVFLLIHLTGENTPRGRWAGISGALLVGAALCLWGLIAIRMSRSSTAAIGFVFLPFEVLFVMPLGYAAGRLTACWLNAANQWR